MAHFYSEQLAQFVDRILALYPESLTADEELFYLDEAKRGSEEAKLRLLRHMIRYMYSESRRSSYYYGVDIDDCFQEACVAMERAIAKFDYGRECRFITYLTYWVRSMVQRMCQMKRLIRVPLVTDVIHDRKATRFIAKYKNDNGIFPTRDQLKKEFPHLSPFALDCYDFRLSAHQIQSLNTLNHGVRRFLLGSSPPTLDEIMERGERVATVRDALRKISPRLAHILTQRSEGVLLEDLARELNLTRERVRQLERKGLVELAAALGHRHAPRYSMAEIHSWCWFT